MSDEPGPIGMLAKLLSVSPDVIWYYYWVGCVIAGIVTLFALLFIHYREYYIKLKYFIEKDRGNIPSKEIDASGVVGGGFLTVIAAFLWPIVVGGASAWFTCLGVVNLCKWIVNLPGNLVEKKLVNEQRSKMLTSPNEDVRWLAEKHSKKNKRT